MFTLEVKKYLISLGATALLATSSMALEKNIDGSVIYPIKDGKYTLYKVNTQSNKDFKFGRTPTKNEEKAWDVAVLPDGTGLPEGKGTVEQGDELYEKLCAMCHGEMGTGGKGYPTLVGGQGSLKNQLVHPENGDEPPIKTIGSYWPYASTLFWYIKTAMPFPHPMSLTNDEVYALVAYLLSVNEITIDGEELDDEYELTKEKFLKIKMPNRDGFYPDVDSKDSSKIMKEFLSNPKNYGAGERCMKNCPTAKVVHIKHELNDFHPALSTVRDLPKEKAEKGVKTKAQKQYEATCSACHGNPAVGAPVLGDKEAWANVLKQPKDVIYKNAIEGKNGMPAKGGDSKLSDEEIKAIVDYMIKESK